MDKQEIRRFMFQKRDALKNKEVLDSLIFEHVIKYALDFNVISIFHSFKGEVDTHKMIETFLELNKTVACPIIVNGKMLFSRINSLKDLEPGHFGLMEPNTQDWIEPEAFDLVLVPMLAFNKNLFRVGYGRGYYDGFLVQTKAMKLGIAYSQQFIDESFEETHDIACDNIMTERGLFK